MKFKQLALAASMTGLLWSGSQPGGNASIPCKGGIQNHPNGSLATCILSVNMSVSVNGSSIPCKAGEYTSFDQNAQFTRCKLSEATTIRGENNQVATCAADNWISVQIAHNGPVIRCGS